MTKIGWFVNAFGETVTVAPGKKHSLRMTRFKRWPESKKSGSRHDPEALTQVTSFKWKLMSIHFVQTPFDPQTAMTFLDFAI